MAPQVVIFFPCGEMPASKICLIFFGKLDKSTALPLLRTMLGAPSPGVENSGNDVMLPLLSTITATVSLVRGIQYFVAFAATMTRPAPSSTEGRAFLFSTRTVPTVLS